MLTGSHAADARGAGRQFLLFGVGGLLLAGLFWMHGMITSAPAPGSTMPGSMIAVSSTAGSVDAAAGVEIGAAEVAYSGQVVSVVAGLLAPSDRQRPGQMPGHGGHDLGHLCVAVLAAGIAVLLGTMLARSALRALPPAASVGAWVLAGPSRRDGPERRGERPRLMLSVWRI